MGYEEELTAALVGNDVVALSLLLNSDNKDRMSRSSGEAPLHVACLHGALGSVRYLVETQRANVINGDKINRHPLHCAVESGCLEVVAFLVEICDGKKWTTKLARMVDDRGTTMLHMAVRHLPVFNRLAASLKLGVADGEGWAKWGELRSNDKCSGVLHHAAAHGSLEAVRLLVEHGADVFDRDATGATALSLAAREGFDAVVDVFLSSIITTQDNATTTPAALACTQDKEGLTAAHWAFMMGHMELGDTLLGMTDAELVDKDGRTAHDCRAALEEQEEEAVAVVVAVDKQEPDTFVVLDGDALFSCPSEKDGPAATVSAKQEALEEPLREGLLMSGEDFNMEAMRGKDGGEDDGEDDDDKRPRRRDTVEMGRALHHYGAALFGGGQRKQARRRPYPEGVVIRTAANSKNGDCEREQRAELPPPAPTATIQLAPPRPPPAPKTAQQRRVMAALQQLHDGDGSSGDDSEQNETKDERWEAELAAEAAEEAQWTAAAEDADDDGDKRAGENQLPTQPPPAPEFREALIRQLTACTEVDEAIALEALERCSWDLDAAAGALTDGIRNGTVVVQASTAAATSGGNSGRGDDGAVEGTTQTPAQSSGGDEELLALKARAAALGWHPPHRGGGNDDDAVREAAAPSADDTWNLAEMMARDRAALEQRMDMSLQYADEADARELRMFLEESRKMDAWEPGIENFPYNVSLSNNASAYTEQVSAHHNEEDGFGIPGDFNVVRDFGPAPSAEASDTKGENDDAGDGNAAKREEAAAEGEGECKDGSSDPSMPTHPEARAALVAGQAKVLTPRPWTSSEPGGRARGDGGGVDGDSSGKCSIGIGL